MLKETPVNLRQAVVIGLGEVGQTTIQKLDELLRTRLQSMPVIGLVTLEADVNLSASEIEVIQEANWWQLCLPLADATAVPAEQKEEAQQLSLHKPDSTLTDSASEQVQMRRAGRQAIRRWSNDLQKLIRQVNDSLRTQDNLTAVRQRTDVKVQIDESALEVFVIAALDEPFASGAFLDLAYLIDYMLEPERRGRFQYHTSGILFLPHSNEALREADTYAALKELDYYTSRRFYTSDFGNRLDFTRNGPPFNRSCYLVETTNEENRSLSDMEQLSALVAEWLYRYLTTPLSSHFRAHGSDFASHTTAGRTTAYSSLGVASFILPIDEAIELCGARLGEEMVRDHLQRDLLPPEQAEPLGHAHVYASHPVSTWLNEALNMTEQVARFRSVDSRYFDNINLWDFEELRKSLKRLFGTNKLTQTLPSIKNQMQQRAEDALERLRQDLPREVNEILDRMPDGGLDWAKIFLDKLRSTMSDAEKEARRQAKEAHKLEESVGNDIALARAQYQSASRIMHPLAIISIIWATVVIGGLFFYTLNIFFQLLPELELTIWENRQLDLQGTNNLAGLLLILGHLVTIGIVAMTTYNWMTVTKQQYIDRHRARLNHSLEKAQQDLHARFYREMQNIVNEEIIRFSDFRDLIDQLEKALRDERERPRLLHETLHFPLEESVLTPEDLDLFYEEITHALEKGLNDFTRDLMSEHGKFSTWATGEVHDLYTKIIDFSKLRMDRLRSRKLAEQLLIAHLEGPTIPEEGRIDVVVEMRSTESLTDTASTLLTLPAVSPQEQRLLHERAAELFTRSRPFLRYDRIQIQSDTAPLTSLLGTYHDDAEATPLNRITSQHFSVDVQRVATNDPHTIVAMSSRHGLPLYALGNLRRYRRSYEQRYLDKPLHTRRDHQALPDLFPLPENALEPRMAVALGCAIKPPGSRSPIIHHDDAELGYYFIQKQSRRADIKVPLGQDKLEACIYLQYATDNLVRLSKQIDGAVVERAERAKSGNEVVIRVLEKYLTENAEELEEWEIVMIEHYMVLLK